MKLRRSSLGGVTTTFLDAEPLIAGLRDRARKLVTTKPDVLEISLFGSLVKGTYGPGSDADLLVILTEDDRRFIDRTAEFLEWFSGLGVPVDVFAYTVEEIQQMKDGGLVKSALADRLVLATRTDSS